MVYLGAQTCYCLLTLAGSRTSSDPSTDETIEEPWNFEFAFLAALLMLLLLSGNFSVICLRLLPCKAPAGSTGKTT